MTLPIISLIDLIVIVFAGTQVVEIIHHGSIFGSKGCLPLRPLAKKWAEGKSLPLRLLGWLVNCPFCLSPWICTALAYSWHPGGTAVKLIIVGFATARGANILNDITHGITRSPGTTQDTDEEISVTLP